MSLADIVLVCSALWPDRPVTQQNVMTNRHDVKTTVYVDQLEARKACMKALVKCYRKGPFIGLDECGLKYIEDMP